MRTHIEMKEKKRFNRFAVIVIIGVVGVVFFLWVWRSVFLCAKKPKGSQVLEQMLQSDDTIIMKTVTNRFTGVKVHLKKAMLTPRSELVISRGRESLELDAGEDVDISHLVTASQTNLAYTLTSKHHEYGSSDEKLIVIKLPQKDRSLSAVDINTVIHMDKLNSDEGRVWIREIKDVSNDGKRLLIERSVPHRVSSTRTTYE